MKDRSLPILRSSRWRRWLWTGCGLLAAIIIVSITGGAHSARAPEAVVRHASSSTTVLREISFLLIFLFGVSASAVFSGLETAVYSMSRVRMLVRQTRGDRQAAQLRRETSDTRRLLSTLLICNNAANFLTSFGFTALVAELMGHGGEGGSVAIDALVLTPLLFIFAETLPKEIARSHADAIVYPAARVLRFLRLVLTVIGLLPLVALAAAGLERLIDRWAARIGDGGGEQQLKEPDEAAAEAAVSAGSETETSAPSADAALEKDSGRERSPTADRAGIIALSRPRVAALLREGIVHGIVSTRQTDLVDRALAMRDVTVADVLLPWAEVIRIPATATPQDVRDRLARRGGLDFIRYPVVDPVTGRVKGVVNLVEWLIEDERREQRRHRLPVGSVEPVRTAGAAAGVALFLPVHLSVREALDRMRRSGVRMAIVGTPLRPVGIATYLDLFEPLTGEPPSAAGVLNVGGR